MNERGLLTEDNLNGQPIQFTLTDMSGNVYNITQTLKPFFHKHNIHAQYFKILPNIKKVLENLYCPNYTIAVELTEKGNVHFHMMVNSYMKKEEFHLMYGVLTKDLGFSDIVDCKSHKQMVGWLNYMSKDLQQTAKAFNTLKAITTKDIPKGFKDKEFTKKDFYIEIKNKLSIEKIISNYNNIYAPKVTDEVKTFCQALEEEVLQKAEKCDCNSCC